MELDSPKSSSPVDSSSHVSSGGRSRVVALDALELRDKKRDRAGVGAIAQKIRLSRQEYTTIIDPSVPTLSRIDAAFKARWTSEPKNRFAGFSASDSEEAPRRCP